MDSESEWETAPHEQIAQLAIPLRDVPSRIFISQRPMSEEKISVGASQTISSKPGS